MGNSPRHSLQVTSGSKESSQLGRYLAGVMALSGVGSWKTIHVRHRSADAMLLINEERTLSTTGLKDVFYCYQDNETP